MEAQWYKRPLAARTILDRPLSMSHCFSFFLIQIFGKADINVTKTVFSASLTLLLLIVL